MISIWTTITFSIIAMGSLDGQPEVTESNWGPGFKMDTGKREVFMLSAYVGRNRDVVWP